MTMVLAVDRNYFGTPQLITHSNPADTISSIYLQYNTIQYKPTDVHTCMQDIAYAQVHMHATGIHTCLTSNAR